MNKAQGERAETTGAINGFVREIVRYYPNLSEELVRVVVVHPGNFLLRNWARSFACGRGCLSLPIPPWLSARKRVGSIT